MSLPLNIIMIHGCILAGLIFIITFQLFLLMYKSVYRIYMTSYHASIVVILVCSFLYNEIKNIHYGKDESYRFLYSLENNNLLQYGCMLVFVLLIIITVLMYIHDKKETNHIIYERSIKEGFDTMETGLCFYDENGYMYLSNRKMNELSRELMHMEVLDGNRFYDFVEQKQPGNEVKWIKSEDLSLIQLKNGRIYGFHKIVITVNGKIVNQMIATDITELYELNEQILKDNESLNTMNERLKKYNNDIAKLTEREEVLHAKISIHNEFGQTLLATAHSLRNHSDNKKELLKAWKRNILLLKNEQKEEKIEGLGYLYDAGKAIGIHVIMEGDLSGWSQSAIRIFNLATKECMTNAKKHAKAKHLFIHIERTNMMYSIILENDGMPCDGVYKEGGGLSGLRKCVEEKGGNMNVITHPSFRIEIEFNE